MKLGPLTRLPRRLKRGAGFARQWLSDMAWHGRYAGPEFPPRLHRALEQGRLLLRSAIDGEDYYLHGLYRSVLSFEEKAAFLGHFGKTRYFDKINPPIYDIVARDKVLFDLLARGLGIPTPEVLATTSASRSPSAGLRLTSEKAVRSFLAEDGSEDLFLKPADGSLGEGALSLGPRIPGRLAWHRLPDMTVIGIDQILDLLRQGTGLRRYLFQRRLRAHPAMANIVADVCPTVRLMTYTAGTPLVLGAALRLGSGDGPTDNLSGGGVVAPIDDASGVLGLAANIDSGIARRSERHPFTGKQITGLALPYWGDVRALALDSAAKLSFLPCIGWDIGITDQGPVIIEINSRPCSRPMQVAHDAGLLAGPLGRALAVHDGILGSGLRVGTCAFATASDGTDAVLR